MAPRRPACKIAHMNLTSTTKKRIAIGAGAAAAANVLVGLPWRLALFLGACAAAAWA